MKSGWELFLTQQCDSKTCTFRGVIIIFIDTTLWQSGLVHVEG